MITDEMILETVIKPWGGIEKFRLVSSSDGLPLIQTLGETGYGTLIIEENDLAEATIGYLERCKVLIIDHDKWYEENPWPRGFTPSDPFQN